jgi:DNA-binding CsgD family transcriptional regulator
MIRVHIEVASSVIKAGLEALLREQPEIEVAASPQDADVTLRDVVFDPGTGPPVVALTDEGSARDALRAGARAALPYTSTPAQIVAAIHAAAACLSAIPASDMALLVPAAPVQPAAEPLTPREMDVLEMLAEGLSNKMIAYRLNISGHTAKFHVNAILAKHCCRRCAAAVEAAGPRRTGSFFVGGETKALPPPPPPANATPGRGGGFGSGDITVNQMYVQYQIPPNGSRHVPVVMVHGCCLSSKTWETTPDGRMGWNEYFVRKDRSVYLADQVSRARSGFDPSTINAAKAGTAPPSQLPNVLAASHQVAWSIFRFGPSYGKAFPDEQFPVDSVDELYKQMIPDLNSTLPMPNPTWTNMGALAVKLKGAVLMGHSESGFFPEEAAMINPAGVKAIISIEMPCTTTLKKEQLSTLAKIPILVMFGDHLGDVQGFNNWPMSFDSCNTFVKQVTDAGGDAQMMSLPKMGIKGNSHMLMQDKNNLQLADLILSWIDKHVEKSSGKSR